MVKRKGWHEESIMKNDEWLTPKHITGALGAFDLDPCSPIFRPWDTASNYFTKEDDGLSQEWFGRVWCNPPYGKETQKWLNKLAGHGNGIALIFARTGTKMFFNEVWDRADSILFLKGRLYFHYVDGKKAEASSASPSVLVAYGENNSKILQACLIEGKYINLSPK